MKKRNNTIFNNRLNVTRYIIFYILVLFSALFIADFFATKILYKGKDLRQFVTKGIFQSDKDLIYSLKPNSYGNWSNGEFTEKSQINGQGFRDVDFNTLKTATKSSVVFMVGDSNVFGHGISDNFKTIPKMIEKKWNSVHNGKILVFNAGVSGYSPDQEYRLISSRIINYHPDIILWMLHLPNDLYNLTVSRNWPVPALYDYQASEDVLVPEDVTHSWLYLQGKISEDWPFISGSILYNRLFKSISGFSYLNNKPDLKGQKLINWATAKLIEEVKQTNETLTDKNIKLYVIYFPYAEYISALTDKRYTKAWNDIRKAIAELNIDSLYLGDYMVKISTENKFLTDNKKQIDSYHDLYFKTDPHLNEYGTEFVGEIISEDLEFIKMLNIDLTNRKK